MNRKKHIKKYLPFFLLGFFLLGVGGCSQEKEGTAYTIYYRDAVGNGIVPSVAYASSEEKEALINEIWTLFVTPPEKGNVMAANVDGLEIQQVFIEGDMLSVYFNEVYSTMAQADELLFRAAFVKTFTQIEEINAISFYVDGNALTDYSGNAIGRMKSSDFVDILGQDINEIENQIVTLYFTNEDGNVLIPCTMEVHYGTGYAIERYVLEALIDGPDSDSHLYPVLPSGLKILSISVKDKTCYVNFDSTFLNSELDVNESVAIYAVVNSLSELSGITKVQIAVNGKSDEKLNGTVSLNQTFERNLDYVQSETKSEK